MIEIKTDEGLVVINASQILYIKAEKKFSVVFFNDDTTLIAYRMLKWFEQFLSPPSFFRSHNSYLINCLHVSAINYCSVIMKNKIRIPISRRKKDNFTENLKQYFQQAGQSFV